MGIILNNKHEDMGRQPKISLRFTHMLLVGVFAFSFVSCSSMDPRNVDVELPETLPSTKVTNYTDALDDLGLMTEIYDTDFLKIQSNPIGDNTGASRSTGHEIPKDITEMIKTSLNAMGGRVVFIPYDPAFIQNQSVTGYSNFENKYIPDLVLSGGITEFDRGLVTRGENTDASLEYEVSGIPDALPSKNLNVRYGDNAKAGLARITLDFNLLDFRTLSGIAKISAVNTMEVNKAISGRELGISIFGQTFGLKGSIKRVQGRHAAVRLLVELSMIEIVGKYLAVPYWRLLGEDALPDPVVTKAIARYYAALSDAEITARTKEWLFLYGYDLDVLNGELDQATQQALANVDPEFTPSDNKIGLDTFQKVYVNIPINYATEKRRQVLASLLPKEEPAEATASAGTDAIPASGEVPSQGKDGQPTLVQQDAGASSSTPEAVAVPVEKAAPYQEKAAQPTLVQQDEGASPPTSGTVAVPVGDSVPAQTKEEKPTLVQQDQGEATISTAQSTPRSKEVQKEVVQQETYQPARKVNLKRTGIGRFLTDEEF